MKQITKDINTLKENDIISVILYALYKLSDDPKYSTISELIYTLDKDSFYKLCSVFGGCTIKIPTLDEIKVLTNVLLIYQYVNNEGKSYTEACDLVGVNKKDTLDAYDLVCDIIEDYLNEQA